MRLKQLTGSLRVATFANDRFRTVADLQVQARAATVSSARYLTVEVGAGQPLRRHSAHGLPGPSGKGAHHALEVPSTGDWGGSSEPSGGSYW